jgi:hypothetical protein
MFGNSIALAALALMLTGGDHRARADGDCLSLIQDLRSQSAQVMAVERRQKIDGLLTSAENELKAGNSVSCQADAKDAQTLLAR